MVAFISSLELGEQREIRWDAFSRFDCEGDD
jgi:hypothetical protein